jgi:hypothetical protein
MPFIWRNIAPDIFVLGEGTTGTHWVEDLSSRLENQTPIIHRSPSLRPSHYIHWATSTSIYQVHTERGSIAISLCTRICEMHSSNLNRGIGYPEIFRGFSQSRSTTASFQILSSLSTILQFDAVLCSYWQCCKIIHRNKLSRFPAVIFHGPAS